MISGTVSKTKLTNFRDTGWSVYMGFPELLILMPDIELASMTFVYSIVTFFVVFFSQFSLFSTTFFE